MTFSIVLAPLMLFALTNRTRYLVAAIRANDTSRIEAEALFMFLTLFVISGLLWLVAYR